LAIPGNICKVTAKEVYLGLQIQACPSMGEKSLSQQVSTESESFSCFNTEISAQVSPIFTISKTVTNFVENQTVAYFA
jgi:hypothetical protein